MIRWGCQEAYEKGGSFPLLEPFVSAYSRLTAGDQGFKALRRQAAEGARCIGRKAQELAAQTYSAKRFVEETRPFLDTFIRKSSKGDK